MMPPTTERSRANRKVLTGSDQVRAANELRALVSNKESWPYVHEFPPPGSEPVHVITSQPTPAAAATIVVASYSVPTGFRFILRAVLQVFTGAVYVPGDATWTTDVNAPLGITDAQGTPVQGLTNIQVPLGSFQWPWPLAYAARAYEFEPLDFIQMKVTNNNLVEGAPNVFTSGLFGYLIHASGSSQR